MKVEEGGLCTITWGHILLSDMDTKLENLHICLQRQPLHGAVLLDGFAMSEGDRFACEDLHTLKVRLEDCPAPLLTTISSHCQPRRTTSIKQPLSFWIRKFTEDS